MAERHPAGKTGGTFPEPGGTANVTDQHDATAAAEDSGPPQAPGGIAPGLDDDPQVAATVRLLHRRRRWAWTFAASVVALVAYLIITVRFFYNAVEYAGVASDIAGVVLILLFALVLIALVMLTVDTVRLHLRKPEVQAQARSKIAGHPVPVRHQPRHVLFWAVLIILIVPAPASLPYQVNGYAYAFGAGRTVTFVPQSHEQWCGRSGCSTVTKGILLTHPPIQSTWQYNVPLGQPFAVRQPVWDGLGAVDLMNGSQAAGAIVMGLFFDVLALLIIGWIISRVRHRRRGWSRGAGAQP
jgi:hypothetical protein